MEEELWCKMPNVKEYWAFCCMKHCMKMYYLNLRFEPTKIIFNRILAAPTIEPQKIVSSYHSLLTFTIWQFTSLFIIISQVPKKTNKQTILTYIWQNCDAARSGKKKNKICCKVATTERKDSKNKLSLAMFFLSLSTFVRCELGLVGKEKHFL